MATDFHSFPLVASHKFHQDIEKNAGGLTGDSASRARLSDGSFRAKQFKMEINLDHFPLSINH